MKHYYLAIQDKFISFIQQYKEGRLNQEFHMKYHRPLERAAIPMPVYSLRLDPSSLQSISGYLYRQPFSQRLSKLK